MFRLAKLSLANRALIALITVFVMVYGVVTTGKLKQELIPSIEFPQVFIMASYPGAGPQVVEQKVTTPIEQAVLSVQGLKSSSSTSSTGQSTVVATMDYGSSMNLVQQDVQAAISRISATLPDGVDTQVITGSIDAFPILMLSASDDSDPVELAERLNRIVVPKLERVDGVRSVEVSGAPEQQVQIKLDQAKLTAAGLSTSDVLSSLTGAGALVAAGTVNDKTQTLSVTVGATFTDAAQVGKVMVVPSTGAPTQGTGQGAPGNQSAAPNQPGQGQTGPGQQQQGQQQQGQQQQGQPAQPKATAIADLGQVMVASAAPTSVSRTDGRGSVTLSITKVPDANTVAVSKAVQDALPDLADEMGRGATFTPVFDQAPFITESIKDLLVEGGLGLVMAIVVILLFLLSVRSTLVTAVSIPVSVLATLIGLQIAGYSLNILTLGALTIAIGRIVDDSIVVIENIKRHLSYGEPKLTAILTAVREVALAITSATITTVAVFLPIGLVSGQTGELFRPFALTVTIALMCSLLVSLTIVPVLAYWFLKPPKKVLSGELDAAAIHAKEQRSPLQRAYLPVLRWSLRHPVICLIIAVLILGGTVGLARGLKTNFLSDAGQNTLTVTQTFGPALSLSEQDKQAAQLEQRLGRIDGVKTVQLTIGQSALSFGTTTKEQASFNLTLDEGADPAQVTSAVHAAAKAIGQDDDVTVSSSGFGGTNSVDIILTGADSKALATASDQVTKVMRTVPGAADVTSTLTSERPQLQVSIRPEAAQWGVTDQMLQQVVQGSLSPTTVGRVQPTSGGSMDLVVEPITSITTIAELGDHPVPTAAGVKKLSQVATITRTTVPSSIAHTDGQRSVTVSLTPDADDLGKVSSAVQTELDKLTLPQGVTAEVGGATKEQNDAFEQLGIALLVAIAIVYVVMVATFKSLVQPLILAISIPFAATGAIGALLLSDTPLGVPALIGVLMLIGIVVTNAIVLIDLVNHYRAQGETLDRALIDGARQRLRPILMTAVATVLALTPMALGISGGGVFISKPLAIVVIGGLVSSTILTLVLVPVSYHLVEGPRERRREGAQRDESSSQGDAGATARESADHHGATGDTATTASTDTTGAVDGVAGVATAGRGSTSPLAQSDGARPRGRRASRRPGGGVLSRSHAVRAVPRVARITPRERGPRPGE